MQKFLVLSITGDIFLVSIREVIGSAIFPEEKWFQEPLDKWDHWQPQRKISEPYGELGLNRKFPGPKGHTDKR